MFPSSLAHFPVRRKFRASPSFTLVEMLVVMVIVAILTAIAVPLIPSLLKANTVDRNVATLSGIMEQAREEAISRNTYVWVAFADPPSFTPRVGTWVAVFESKDGTESPINTAVTPAWTVTGITVPGNNLQLVNKLQSLPGTMITNATTATLPASVIAQATAAGITGATNLFGLPSTAGVQWTVTPLQNTEGYVSPTYFTHVIEFTPDGEAHVQYWNNNIQFAMIPSFGTGTNNAVLMNVARLTGKLTVFRP